MLWDELTVETVLKQTKVQMEPVEVQCNSILKEKFSVGSVKSVRGIQAFSNVTLCH